MMPRPVRRPERLRVPVGLLLVAIVSMACTPGPAAAPTAAPAKPTEAAAKPAASPAVPAAGPAAASPIASPSGSPSASPVAAPAASPSPAAAAKPATAAAYDERAVADFFRGKTFRIIVGFQAGGGYDTIFRLWGRHASKHIPGNPTVIVENMTGAGGLVAANHLYKAAPKDGTTMGAMDLFAAVLGQAAGGKGIEFDANNFAWVGNPGDEGPAACATRADLGFSTFGDYLKSGKELVFGASGKGNPFYATPRIIAAATGAKIRVIDGYQGNPAVRLAVDNRELDGACWTWASMRTTAAAWFETTPMPVNIILQSGSKPYSDMPNVELIRDYVKDPTLLRMVDVLERAIFNVYLAAMPPEVPADRLAAVRDAWLKTWNDPELQADLARTQFRFSPVSGQDTEQVVRNLLAMPPDEAKLIGQTFGLID